MSACAELRACLRPAFTMLALAAVLACAARLILPQPVPVVDPVPLDANGNAAPLTFTPADLAARPGWLDTAIIIDARSASAYADSHFPGAIRLAPAEWEELLPALIERWEPGRPVLVYCEAGGCELSREVAARLRRELADDHIHALDGDWRSLLKRPDAPPSTR